MTCVGRLRAAATAIAIGVSLFAVMATSPARAEVGDSAEGHPFVLSPSHPDVNARFVVEASRAVFDEPASIGLDLDVEPFWSGIGSHPADLPVDVNKVAGPVAHSSDFRDGPSCGGPQCIGTYDVTFRWPSQLDAGTVRVEWAVSFSASYDRADPPAGAIASVRLEQPKNLDAPTRFFEDDLALGREAPTALRRIWILTTASIPDGTDLAVELDEPSVQGGESTTVVTLIEEGRSPAGLPPASATPIEVPGRCRIGPCGFWFLLAFRLHPSDNWSGSFVSWELTASAPVPQIAVQVEEAFVPTVAGRSSLGRIHLQGDQTIDPLLVTAEVTPQALPDGELGGLAPVIQGRVFLHADPKTLVSPEHGKLETQVAFPALRAAEGEPTSDVPSFSFPSYDDTIAEDVYPISFVVPTSCRADRPCEFTMTVQFTTAQVDEGSIDVEPTIEVLLSYPILGADPPGAEVEVSVERAA